MHRMTGLSRHVTSVFEIADTLKLGNTLNSTFSTLNVSSTRRPCRGAGSDHAVSTAEIGLFRRAGGADGCRRR